jgi:hypothetical protein
MAGEKAKGFYRFRETGGITAIAELTPKAGELTATEESARN